MTAPVIQPLQGWSFYGTVSQGRPIELANPGLDDCHPFRMSGAGKTASLKGMKHPAQGWSDVSDLPWVNIRPPIFPTLKALEHFTPTGAG
jgi:hypothetical protein